MVRQRQGELSQEPGSVPSNPVVMRPTCAVRISPPAAGAPLKGSSAVRVRELPTLGSLWLALRLGAGAVCRGAGTNEPIKEIVPTFRQTRNSGGGF